MAISAMHEVLYENDYHVNAMVWIKDNDSRYDAWQIY